jgi:predicted lipoprotein with Yx(FWY)xxD motif
MSHRRTRLRVAVLFAILALLLAACQPIRPEGELDAAAPADAPAEAAEEMPAEMAGGIMLSSTEELGEFLVDSNGMTLYLYTRDEPGVTNCYDNCAVRWPPLLAEGEVSVGEGVDASLLGTTTRTDGSIPQVTYNGWPLYYFQDDAAPGDVVGQGRGDVWFVVSRAGEIVGYPTIMASENEELGEFLVDSNGMTLYMFLRDTPGVTNCYGQCAERWPPLYAEGDVILGSGLDANLLGTTTRTDDPRPQITYNGWPLYYWYEDVNPGDTLGQNVGQVWYVLSPAGEIIGLPTVKVGNTEALGEFLVDGWGMTLYLFTNDTPGVSNCYDQCAERWPPLLVEGEPVLGNNIDAALIGTTERTDGTTQLTYNGWPLYYWYEDMAPGDTLGQGVGDVWYVISPAGEMVQ